MLRTSDFFAGIYNDLLKKIGHIISESRIKELIKRQTEIFDSLTICLYQDIVKCVVKNPNNEKKVESR